MAGSNAGSACSHSVAPKMRRVGRKRPSSRRLERYMNSKWLSDQDS